ncbi:LacI family DNA-binding transcriptional regulator [Mycolicibacterium agri]|uniref:LacI family transcriptional regulator n=1 Tax=Mycolicibacterium agri TaxID=36811 RepID=A0A7I9W3T8_MYCAG|nr:LacI family DNA-binding transcriptional regulator [Mycolicibacterium agri]GFG52374.1 LacI family transcriptional regulator [Mycolicibacterium agri]
MDKPTLADVARAAGVHPGTASRALNPALVGRISPETTARVQQAAERLGYVPDPLGRSLRTSRTHTIGVVIPDLGNPVFAPIVRGIEDQLRERGFEPLLASTDNSAERERDVVGVLRTRRCDGFIVASAGRGEGVVHDLVDAGVPLVLVNRLVDGVDVSAVVSDDAVGIGAAIEHLAALGHRRIGHIGGPLQISVSATRLAAFTNAVASDVGGAGVIEHATDYTIEAGRVAMTALLAREQVTAVFAANDLLAVGGYEALAAQGLRCPDDVSVVGFNNMELTAHLNPSLSTVSMPQYEMGRTAAKLVLDRLAESDGASQTVALPTVFVPRASTCQARA